MAPPIVHQPALDHARPPVFDRCTSAFAIARLLRSVTPDA